jgi:hypothetical protein
MWIVATVAAVLIAAGVAIPLVLSGGGGKHAAAPALSTAPAQPVAAPTGTSQPQAPQATDPGVQTPAALSDSPTATPAASSPETTVPPLHPIPSTPLYVSLPKTFDVGGGQSLTVQVKDHVTDCATHAYGQAATFLTQHPCAAADRTLDTVSTADGSYALSVIAVSLVPDSSSDPNGAQLGGSFVSLLESDGTGSMNDLVRDGHPFAGAQGKLPADEAFSVSNQGSNVTILDAWWVGQPTTDQDPTLVADEAQLLGSAAVPFDIAPAGTAPTAGEAVLTACQELNAAGTVDAATSGPFRYAAATDATRAASIDPTLNRFAAGLTFDASLPLTDNTEADVDQAMAYESIIEATCQTAGVSVSD